MILKSKIVSFLGDSITEGYGVENIADNRYDNIIKNKLELKAVNNYGVSGTRIAHQSVPSESPRYDLCMCGRAHFIDPNSNVIVVFGGTNDYGHGDAPFGVLEDNTPKTFCGAVEYLMSFLKTTYPKSEIIFMTPLRRCGEEQPSNDINKRNDAKPLKEYAEVIKQKANKYNIHIVDLYNDFKVNPNIESDKIKYIPDGLHPNDNGHKLLAECIMQGLEKL